MALKWAENKPRLSAREPTPLGGPVERVSVHQRALKALAFVCTTLERPGKCIVSMRQIKLSNEINASPCIVVALLGPVTLEVRGN